MKKTEQQVGTMLADTILALCRNTLPYNDQFNVEGLLAITLDNNEIFLVNINEKIEKERISQRKSTGQVQKRTAQHSEEGSSENDSDLEASPSAKRKRKRPRKKTRSPEKESPGDLSDRDNINDNVSEHEDILSVKAEADNSGNDSDDECDGDVSFVKQEMQQSSPCMFADDRTFENNLPFGMFSPSSQAAAVDQSFSQTPTAADLAFQASALAASSAVRIILNISMGEG